MHFEHFDFLHLLENNKAPTYLPTFHAGSIPSQTYKYGLTIVDISGTSVSSFNYNDNNEFIETTSGDCFMVEPVYGFNEKYDNIVMSLCIKDGDIYHFYVFSHQKKFFENINTNWKIYQAFDFDGTNFSLVENTLFKNFGNERITSKELSKKIPLFECFPTKFEIKHIFE